MKNPIIRLAVLSIIFLVCLVMGCKQQPAEKAEAESMAQEDVKLAAEKTYPNAVLKKIMMITAVVDGQDALEGYEIVLQTEDNKKVEITVAPDATVKEDSGKG